MPLSLDIYISNQIHIQAIYMCVSMCISFGKKKKIWEMRKLNCQDVCGLCVLLAVCLHAGNGEGDERVT